MQERKDQKRPSRNSRMQLVLPDVDIPENCRTVISQKSLLGVTENSGFRRSGGDQDVPWGYVHTVFGIKKKKRSRNSRMQLVLPDIDIPENCRTVTSTRSVSDVTGNSGFRQSGGDQEVPWGYVHTVFGFKKN
jgi:hypothetical protein